MLLMDSASMRIDVITTAAIRTVYVIAFLQLFSLSGRAQAVQEGCRKVPAAEASLEVHVAASLRCLTCHTLK